MANIFQSKEWAIFKTKSGYEKYYEISGVFVLQKRLPGGKTMLYSPMVDRTQEKVVRSKDFLDEIQKIAKENKSIFYRLELDIPSTLQLLPSSFVKAFEEMQPEHTLIIDISADVETILANMKQKGRYNIRVAEKSGIKILKNKSIDGFYQLYTTMAKRSKISYRSKAYFQSLIDLLTPNGYCEVFEAYLEQDLIKNQSDEATNENIFDTLRPADYKLPPVPLAAAIVTYCGDRATYLFGGSSNENRNLKAPSLLQYEIILDAKKRKCTEYDLFGIAPNDDENHPWSGVTKFKKQFGGREVQLLGSYDLIIKPLEYKLFKMAEKIRR